MNMKDVRAAIEECVDFAYVGEPLSTHRIGGIGYAYDTYALEGDDFQEALGKFTQTVCSELLDLREKSRRLLLVWRQCPIRMKRMDKILISTRFFVLDQNMEKHLLPMGLEGGVIQGAVGELNVSAQSVGENVPIRLDQEALGKASFFNQNGKAIAIFNGDGLQLLIEGREVPVTEVVGKLNELEHIVKNFWRTTHVPEQIYSHTSHPRNCGKSHSIGLGDFQSLRSEPAGQESRPCCHHFNLAGPNGPGERSDSIAARDRGVRSLLPKDGD